MSHDATPLVETTEDGSLTLFAPTFGEHYHSTHGAVQESLHIYIGLALEERLRAEQGATEPLRLFEVGFGTGLNALLTWQRAEAERRPVHYYSIEKYPVAPRSTKPSTMRVRRGHWILPKPSAHSIPLRGVRRWRLVPSLPSRSSTATSPNAPSPEGLSVIYYDAFSPD